MFKRKIGTLLLLVALLLVLAGCSQNIQSGAAITSPSAQATQSDHNEPVAPSASSAVVTPSSEASKNPQEPKASEVSQPQEPSASPITTPEPKPPSKPVQKPDVVSPAADSIMLSIEGNAEWGTVLAAERVMLSAKDTVADMLKRTAKAYRLSFEIRGSGAMTYIRAIDGLYEFDDGPTSGWKYRVNGEIPDIGAGSYKLKAGDTVEWFYTSEDEEMQGEKETAS